MDKNVCFFRKSFYCKSVEKVFSIFDKLILPNRIMRQSKLMELLHTFSFSERKRFRLFVSSPYFTQGENTNQLAALLELCFDMLEKPSETLPNKETMHSILFPNSSFVKGKVEKLMSALHRLAMDFLIVEDAMKPENAPDRQTVLADELQNRGLFDRCGDMLKALRKTLTNSEKHDSPYYQRFLRLVLHENHHAILQPTRSIKVTLNDGFEALYLFYQHIKMEMATSIRTLRVRIAYEPSPLAQRMLQEQLLDSDIVEKKPLLAMSMQFMDLINRSETDIKALNHFVQTLRNTEHLLPFEDAQRAWSMARNISLNWWNYNKKENLLRMYFDLSLENIERGLLYYHGTILHHALESVCKAALELGHTETAFQLLQDHRGKISGEPDDEPFYRYNMARYYLYTGDADKALALLPQFTPDNSYHINTKVLEIQILYELGSDLLPYRMDALRLFLNRSADRYCSPERKFSLRYFLNSLARIHRCPLGNTRRAGAIQDQIRKTTRVSEYRWLISMAGKKAIPVAEHHRSSTTL